MPAPVLIPNRPLLPRLLLLFWVAEIAVGLLFAVAGYGLLRPGENGGAVVLMLMGLVLVVAGIVMVVVAHRVLVLLLQSWGFSRARPLAARPVQSL